MALLKPTTNKEGKKIVRLYGKDFDVTDLTELTAFGATYRIANPVKTKTRHNPKFINSAERSTEPDEGAGTKQAAPEVKATSAEE